MDLFNQYQKEMKKKIDNFKKMRNDNSYILSYYGVSFLIADQLKDYISFYKPENNDLVVPFFLTFAYLVRNVELDIKIVENLLKKIDYLKNDLLIDIKENLELLKLIFKNQKKEPFKDFLKNKLYHQFINFYTQDMIPLLKKKENFNKFNNFTIYQFLFEETEKQILKLDLNDTDQLYKIMKKNKYLKNKQFNNFFHEIHNNIINNLQINFAEKIIELKNLIPLLNIKIQQKLALDTIEKKEKFINNIKNINELNKHINRLKTIIQEDKNIKYIDVNLSMIKTQMGVE